MDLKPIEEEQKGDENTITEEREELMIPPYSGGNPTLRIAHFLKPLLNPKIQPFPKPPFHHSLSSNPNIEELKKAIKLRSFLKPQRSWKSWVEELQQTHEIIWKKIGIFDAIKGSTYKIISDKELMMCLAEKWCSETNTFVFSWGESTVTLEDIMILGGFPVIGNSVLNPCSDSKKFAEIKDELIKCFPIIRRNNHNALGPNGWLEYFKGKGGELEHVGFLVLWLSRYVLSYGKCISVKNNVFDIAISLALGNKVALAPAVLASIYRDLTTLKQKIVHHAVERVVAGSEVVLWGPLHFVQLWAWERFLGASPNPNSLVYGEPRIACWHNVKRLIISLDVESGDGFLWRPYAMSLKNWGFPKFYCDEGMWMVVNSELDEELLSFVRCLRACELVGLDCVMQYLPHRVGMQFGMDQDIPDFVPRFDDDYELAWSSYAKSLEGVKVYLPPRLFEGDITMQYSKWWRLRLLGVDVDNVFINYSRRKRSSRKRKSFSQLLKGGVGGRCTSMALSCSSSKGAVSEKPPNVVNKIASSVASLNQQESIVDDKVDRNMADYATSNTALNEQMEGIVAEKGEMDDDTASNTALNEEEDIVTEQSHVTNAQDISELATMVLLKTVDVNEPGLETKKVNSVLAEDRSQLGKDATEAEVKHTYDLLVDDVEKVNDSARHFQERSLLIETRISRLEKTIYAQTS